jgi:DNA-binding transcriptional ArsR family regulator
VHDHDDRAELRVPVDVEDAWARYMITERRALRARVEGITAEALAEALPEESPEELDRIARKDRRLAKEGLVELMDQEGEIYYKRIDELDRWEVADRLRAEIARSEWLARRTEKRIK